MIISPVFAKASPNSFNVKVEYIYTEGDRMIVSWDEGQVKHTLYPVTEGGNPINVLTYYKAGEFYPASNPTTQMRVYDNSNNPHLFNLDANAGAPQAAPQAAPKTAPHNQPTYSNQLSDASDAIDILLAVTLIVGVVVTLSFLSSLK